MSAKITLITGAGSGIGAALAIEADRLGMTALAELAGRGALVPTIAATFPLEQVGQAQSYRVRTGKVVLTL